MQNISWNYHKRHYDHRFVYLLPIFWRQFLCFQWVFFQKILSLYMVSILERFLIKSGLWWRSYGTHLWVKIKYDFIKILVPSVWIYHTTCDFTIYFVRSNLYKILQNILWNYILMGQLRLHKDFSPIIFWYIPDPTQEWLVQFLIRMWRA